MSREIFKFLTNPVLAKFVKYVMIVLLRLKSTSENGMCGRMKGRPSVEGMSAAWSTPNHSGVLVNAER